MREMRLMATTATQKTVVRYRNSVVVPANRDAATEAPDAAVAAFLRNAQTLGFAFTVDAINRFKQLNLADFKAFAVDVLSALKELKGANFNYAPMYPNFPSQVASATDAELYVNALLHYLGDIFSIRITPEYDKEERFAFYDEVNLTVLGAVDESVFESILRNLLASKVSFSEADVASFNHLVGLVGVDGFIRNLPDAVVNKENLAYAAAAVWGDVDATRAVIAKAATATDVLRIIAVYSGAHPSLGEKFRVGTLRRSERRLIVESLNRMSGLTQEFKKNRETWKRVAERLHLNEYTLTDEVRGAFAAVRSSSNIPSWGTAVEAALLDQDVKTSVKLLSERPGYFARRLNQILEFSASDEIEFIISEYSKVAGQVSTSVLWQVAAFFRTLKENPNRKYSTIFTKGVGNAAYPLERTATHIPASVTDEVLNVTMSAIIANYSDKETLGKVCLKTDDYNPVVPFGLRNTSDAFRVVGRGTKTKFDVKKTLRFFVYWKDQGFERVDLDLSAVALDENFAYVGAVTYYNLRENGILHSGDITSAPNGASEFIDVDVAKYTKSNKNARYIVMTVHSFTHQKFSALDEVTAGFMVRDDVQSGEIYEPASVENAFVVNSNSTNTAPVIFDLLTGEAVWLDLPLKGSDWANNVRNTAGTLSAAVEGIVKREYVTVQDVVKANVTARGTVVDSEDDADIVIDLTASGNTIGFDEIISKWL